jgi:hypothetical protein
MRPVPCNNTSFNRIQSTCTTSRTTPFQHGLQLGSVNLHQPTMYSSRASSSKLRHVHIIVYAAASSSSDSAPIVRAATLFGLT